MTELSKAIKEIPSSCNANRNKQINITYYTLGIVVH